MTDTLMRAIIAILREEPEPIDWQHPTAEDFLKLLPDIEADDWPDDHRYDRWSARCDRSCDRRDYEPGGVAHAVISMAPDRVADHYDEAWFDDLMDRLRQWSQIMTDRVPLRPPGA